MRLLRNMSSKKKQLFSCAASTLKVSISILWSRRKRKYNLLILTEHLPWALPRLPVLVQYSFLGCKTVVTIFYKFFQLMVEMQMNCYFTKDIEWPFSFSFTPVKKGNILMNSCSSKIPRRLLCINSVSDAHTGLNIISLQFVHLN